MKKLLLMVMFLALSGSAVLLAASGKIAGVVTDKDGNPLDGVEVTVSSADGTVSERAKSNKRGKFTMTIKDPSKTYTVRLQREGYDPYEGPIEITERETLTAEFKLLSVVEGEQHRAALEAIQTRNKASRLYNEGVELYNGGDAESAAGKFREALAEDEGLAIALAGIGRIDLEAERYDLAIESLERFEELEPGRLPILLMLNDAYEGAGQVEKASAVVDRLVAEHPGPQAAARVFNQGVAAVGASDLPRARERFGLALELNPDLYQAHVNLAHIHRAFEDWSAALTAVDAFLERDPEHVRALALRYEVLRELDRQEDATAALALLREVSPEEAAEVFHEQGVRLFNANERDLALQSFRSALEIQPNHPHAHYMLGLCMAGSGEIEQAKALLSKFLELDPENPDAAAAKEMLAALQ